MTLSALYAPKGLVFAGAVVGAIGGGLFLLLRSPAEPRKGVVRIFFCSPYDRTEICLGGRPTQAQVDAVASIARRLTSDGSVERFRFLSHRAALARMRKLHPAMAKSLTSNPFPDAEELVVRDDDAADVQARFPHGRNGVSKVIYESNLAGRAG